MKNSSHRDEYPAMQSNGPLPQVKSPCNALHINLPSADAHQFKSTHTPSLYDFKILNVLGFNITPDPTLISHALTDAAHEN